MMKTGRLIFIFAFAAHLTMAADHKSVDQFLKQHCVKCHGAEKQKGDLAFHELAKLPVAGKRVEVWQRIYDQLARGEMPPEKEKQPSLAQRAEVAQWIRAALVKAGVVDSGAWLDPSRGNWVNHDLLFSGKSGKAGGATATRGRLWRLSGQAYWEFIQALNVKYRLGFRTYGHQRVRSPWGLAASEGFRDFAAQHRIGEPEIEQHLRNATRVARALVARLPKSRQTPVLTGLVRSKEAPTAEQVRAAAGAAFEGILGREPTKAELERYHGFLAGSLKRLGTEKGLEQLLIAVLFHPEAMYRVELPAAGEPRARMKPRDMARAIAYTLTDREPDAALRQAVVDGKLSSNAEVRAQVMRILNDGEIDKPRILRFFQEYFGYTRAIDVFKDSATRKAAGFRGKNDWHPNFFVSDADRLVQWIVDRDKDVLRELLTTPQTFAVTGNTKAANGVKKSPTKPFNAFAQTALNIYELKLERKDWTDERPFAMPRAHRMGLLTHPAWLIAHSTNFDNHAIHRGRWIRERLLGGLIPDLPVTVDAQLPDEPDKPLRERMRVTRKAYCWKCHQHMDPLGLPLEQFDHFGRFRTTELKLPVDTTGAITRSGDARLDGEIKTPFEMIQKLAESKRVEQVFVRHAFRYFLGRNETSADGPALVAAHEAYVKGGGSLKALIASLLTSDAFLYRTSNVKTAQAGQPKGRNDD